MDITISDGYQHLIEKIMRHRPHLTDPSRVAERALDYYLDYIVRTDNKKLKQGGE